MRRDGAQYGAMDVLADGVTSAHGVVGDLVVLPAPGASLVVDEVLQVGDLEEQREGLAVPHSGSARLLGSAAAARVVAVVQHRDVREVGLAVGLDRVQ